MRRFIKIELLKIVKNLEEAHDAVQKGIGTKNAALFLDLLVECQQNAIQIGNRIEELEGEGTATVALLEHYCESVYQLSELLQDNKKANRLIKEIQNLLPKITSSIRYDIPDSKKEIVFLPYKASMWDCFESVWMAAQEDPDCDPYVIPIPYYDKNSDGILTQIYYEGNEYPDNVPIISWEEYSISDKHPDVIYIHNPYDNCNQVTSILPAFYAKELKKHTDMLVYIPYFVSMDDIPEHFCVLPGTMYADKVIVQSEKVRDTYIREFHKFEKENNCKDIFGNAEEKFLALGSPKFDKVLNINREDVSIPVEWEKLIFKPNGTRKKIVFYNTTIQALLENNEKYLEKIQSVLKLFYENRENCTLLWRPHPLNESTIASMRPALLEEYRRIVKQYKMESYGIFDDTSDLHRGIAISDAYYGDWSSVVALYQKKGKPVMIQNTETEVVTL